MENIAPKFMVAKCSFFIIKLVNQFENLCQSRFIITICVTPFSTHA